MALGTCAVKLAAAATRNCSDPVTVDTVKQGYILNVEDVDIEATKASYISGSNNIYSTLAVKVGKKGYAASHLLPPKTTKNDGTYINTYTKVVMGTLLDDGDVPASVIEALGSKDGRFIVVYEHDYKDLSRTLSPGSSAFEIFGLETPMNATGQAIERDKASADTHGGWTFGLQCIEQKPEYLWYDGTYGATKTSFDALGTAAV